MKVNKRLAITQTQLILFMTVLLTVAGCAGSTGKRVGQKPVTIVNPILHADYSDPDVVCVGEDYYMTTSSFNCVPGLPILHSRDLVNWTLIGHAVARFPQEGYDTVQLGNGVWAPSIRYHHGEFFIHWGDPDRGIFMVKATNPAGPWEPPHLVKEGKGLIDPCPLWDDDGKAYLIHAWAKSRAGINSILTVYEMSPDGKRLLDEGMMIVDGRGNPELDSVEGPKFYKHNGLYYILAPAGGVSHGWQMAFRSKNVRGPYEMKRVLEQGSTEINGPHQGAWVIKPDGTEWFIHFQDKNAYGRVIHIQPVTWTEGWPDMGRDLDGNGVGEPYTILELPTGFALDPSLKIQRSDEFESAQLGLQWQWMANPQDDWYSLTTRPGWLRFYATNPAGTHDVNKMPNLLVQKWQSLEFEATARIDLSGLTEGDRFGLAVTGKSPALLEVHKTGNVFELASVNQSQQNKPVILHGNDIFLRITITEYAQFQSSYSLDGVSFLPIGEPQGIHKGHWFGGSKIGFYCLSNENGDAGHADVDWIRMEDLNP